MPYMKLTTQNQFADHKIQKTLGLVMGNTVRTRHIGSNFLAGLLGIVAGEVAGYTQLLSEAREEATNRLIQSATDLGADGIVGVRYTIANVMDGMIEILAFGTAVKLN